MTSKRKSRFLLSAVLIVILTAYAKEMSAFILQGIKISVFTVIPAIFPFLVLADYLSAESGDFPFDGFLARIFNIPRKSVGALVCGIICGFPSGVKYCARLYESKNITKEEFERLIGLVNNPSIAFVVSAVGIGFMNSQNDGILLFLSIIISVIITARTFKMPSQKMHNSDFISKQSFDFIKSIRDAGISALYISSYIVFFSSVIGFIKIFIKNGVILAFLASTLEIGNATSIISLLTLNEYHVFFLYGFALGFSGFSVHLQAFSLLPYNIKKGKYLLMKLFQGITCALCAAILKTFFNLI